MRKLEIQLLRFILSNLRAPSLMKFTVSVVVSFSFLDFMYPCKCNPNKPNRVCLTSYRNLTPSGSIYKNEHHRRFSFTTPTYFTFKSYQLRFIWIPCKIINLFKVMKPANITRAYKYGSCKLYCEALKASSKKKHLPPFEKPMIKSCTRNIEVTASQQIE